VPDAPFEANSKISHRRRARVLTAYALAATSFIAFLATLANASRFPGVLGLVLTVGAMAWLSLLALVLAVRRPSTKPARVRADARGVFANDTLVVARDVVRAGYLQPRAAGLPVVRLECRKAFEVVDVEVKDASEGAKLLAALGLDASRSVVHFRVRRGIFASNRAQAIVSGLIGSSSYAIWIVAPEHHKLPFMLVYFALVSLNLWPTKMSIGADGVLVSSLWARHFYPFAKVAAVETNKWGIVLVTRRGERVDIRTRTGARKNRGPDDATRAIVARIRAGVDALATSTVPDAAALVGRGARTYDAWIDALRELGRDGDYRAAALPPDELWRVLEDPAAEASARAGAAMALRTSLDGEGRQRLRVASAASVSPRVRVALDVIARVEADDAALREALEACDAEGEGSERAERA
jgi:hypothetical protein